MSEEKKTKRRGRGEGLIDVLPSGKFRVRVSCTESGTGKRVVVTNTFDTKREALVFRDDMERRKRAGMTVLPPRSARKVGDWLDDWLAVQRT